MRRNRNATVEVNCPECEAPLKVEVSPLWPGVRYYPDGSGAPPEPAEIVDIRGEHQTCPEFPLSSQTEVIDGDQECPLKGQEFDDAGFYDIVLAALDDEEEAARDREDDSRMERERERREDWDPQESLGD